LLNGGFDFFQRTAPGTATERNDDNYGPDRWNLLTQTAAAKISRTSGPLSLHAFRFTQHQASAQRIGTEQIVEAVNAIPYRGSDMTFSLQIRCSVDKTIRIAILSWTGTADTVTSDVVNDWTSTSYVPGGFFLASGLSVDAVGSLAVSANIWTPMSLIGTISASCNNIICVCWSEGTLAQNVTLDFAEAGLYLGSSAPAWQPRPIAQELTLCQRYFEKSYDIDTPAGDVTNNGTTSVNCSYNNLLYVESSYYKVTKRYASAPVLFAPVSGTADKLRDQTANVDVSCTINGVSDTGYKVWNEAADWTTGNRVRWHFICGAEL
jgi:hypothetical protein